MPIVAHSLSEEVATMKFAQLLMLAWKKDCSIGGGRKNIIKAPCVTKILAQNSCSFILTIIAQNKLNPASVSVAGTDPLERSFSLESDIHQKKNAKDRDMAIKL